LIKYRNIDWVIFRIPLNNTALTKMNLNILRIFDNIVKVLHIFGYKLMKRFQPNSSQSTDRLNGLILKTLLIRKEC
jgi:hypothetical protein